VLAKTKIEREENILKTAERRRRRTTTKRQNEPQKIRLQCKLTKILN